MGNNKDKCSTHTYLYVFFLTVSEIDQYLWMVGGSAGALALTGVAAASAFYLSTRPKPEKPLVTLHEQSLTEQVSYDGPMYPLALEHHQGCN